MNSHDELIYFGNEVAPEYLHRLKEFSKNVNYADFENFNKTEAKFLMKYMPFVIKIYSDAITSNHLVRDLSNNLNKLSQSFKVKYIHEVKSTITDIILYIEKYGCAELIEFMEEIVDPGIVDMDNLSTSLKRNINLSIGSSQSTISYDKLLIVRPSKIIHTLNLRNYSSYSFS